MIFTSSMTSSEVKIWWRGNDITLMTSHQWHHHDVMTSSPRHQTVTLDDGIDDVAMMMSSGQIGCWWRHLWRHGDVMTSSIRHQTVTLWDVPKMTRQWLHGVMMTSSMTSSQDKSKLHGGASKKSTLFRVKEAELLRVPCTVCLKWNRHAVLGSF